MELLSKKNKFDSETVEKSYQDFCEDWDIDDNIEAMDEEDSKEYKNLKRKIIRVMGMGRLIYNSDETFTYNFKKPVGQGDEGKDIKIKRPDGGNYLDMDSYKEKQSMRKKNAVLAGMIKMPTSFISKIDGVDLKILDAILTLFLVS